jgi:hypothetical protein
VTGLSVLLAVEPREHPRLWLHGNTKVRRRRIDPVRYQTSDIYKDVLPLVQRVDVLARHWSTCIVVFLRVQFAPLLFTRSDIECTANIYLPRIQAQHRFAYAGACYAARQLGCIEAYQADRLALPSQSQVPFFAVQLFFLTWAVSIVSCGCVKRRPRGRYACCKQSKQQRQYRQT